MGGNPLEPARRGQRRDPTDVPARRIGGNAPKSFPPPSHEAHEVRVVMTPCCVREFLSVALFFRRPAKRKTPGKSPGKSSVANQLTRVSGLPSRFSDAIHRRSRPEAICPESLMASSSPSPVRQGPALLPRQPQSPHPGRPSRSEPLAGPDTSGVPIVPTRTGPSSAATKSPGLWGDPRHGSPHPRPRYTRRGPGKSFRLRKAIARRWVPGMLRPANPEHHPFHYSSLVYPRYVSIRLTQYFDRRENQANAKRSLPSVENTPWTQHSRNHAREISARPETVWIRRNCQKRTMLREGGECNKEGWNPSSTGEDSTNPFSESSR